MRRIEAQSEHHRAHHRDDDAEDPNAAHACSLPSALLGKQCCCPACSDCDRVAWSVGVAVAADARAAPFPALDLAGLALARLVPRRLLAAAAPRGRLIARWLWSLLLRVLFIVHAFLLA